MDNTAAQHNNSNRSFFKFNQLNSAGFSLIELLIAIAIVGILASVAQPMYTDYVIRARMSEPIQIADNLSSRIVQCMVFNGSPYASCNSFNELNIIETEFVNGYIESISFHATQAEFTVNLQNTGNTMLDQGSLTYSGNLNTQIIRWQCKISSSTLNNLVSVGCRI